MKPDAPLKLVSQLLDLPLVDKDGRWCGVVDDVELQGSAGKETRIKALLVGPGAYKGRMPGWMYWIVRKVAGDRIARVPVKSIDRIASAVHLNCTAEVLKLHVVEDEVRRWIPRWGAL
jgi:sporulation protein YlmC with PRC-barrel domain